MATTAPQTFGRRSSPLVHYDLKRDILAGAIAGQIAGLIMAVAMVTVFKLYLSTHWYHPVQVIGSFALGDAAVKGGFHLPAFLAGLAIHQLVATLLWSIPFALLVNRLEHNAMNVLAAGLAIGAISQLVDIHLVVPAIMNGLHGHNIWAENVPNVWSWIAHVVFGIGFLTFMPVWRRFELGRRPR